MKQQLMVFPDIYSEPAARSQADAEKASAFGWAAKAKIWDRPKDADITLVSSEKRFEPFWNIKASREIKFEFKTTYAIKPANPNALTTTVMGQTLDFPVSKTVVLSGMEYCEKRVELSEFFHGLKTTSLNKTPAEYVAKYNSLVSENETDLALIPPEITAALIAQEIRKRLMEPVDATNIISDELAVHELLLYYRPVYAFEYAWRDKRGVVEIDALTGNVNREGNMLASMAKSMMTRENLFDVGAELASALIPGGSVIVKLVNVATKPVGAGSH